MKSYIIHKGGQYGDLVFSIVNNGVHLPLWIQSKLKNNAAKNDNKFRSFIDKVYPKIITGCASYPLDWGYNNYELICTDQYINDFSVTRLLVLNNDADLNSILKSYYNENVRSFIDDISQDQMRELLVKKYQAPIVNLKVPQSNLINIDCIYDKVKFINRLTEYFTFDIELAGLQYDQWYERESLLFNEMFKSV